MQIKNFITLIIILVIGFLYIRWPFYNYLHYWWSFWLWFVGLMLIASIFGECTRRIDNRRRGREAELDVEDEVKSLPNNFQIIPNLDLGRGDVDEVIVGPTGIFVIETKSHFGNITLNGVELEKDGRPFEKDFIKQVWAETYTIRDLVAAKLNKRFKVQPVLVFSNVDARLHFGLKKVKGVFVIGRKWLNNLVLRNVLERLDFGMIGQVSNILNAFTEEKTLTSK